MDVKNYSIHEVLSHDTSFYIPPFQRSYSWGKTEIDRYFTDVEKIIKSERNCDEKDKLEHFFGTLVLKNETNGLTTRRVVVDGQQRLTTTLLLIIALRDFAKGNDEKSIIENRYLKNSASTFSDKIKLKQVTKDWDAYLTLVKNGSVEVGNKLELVPGKITDGYNRFLSKIKKLDYEIKEYLIALSRVNVACIFLDERPFKGEDPQIIFETLNSLGKPLTFADLIRNYIMLGLPSNEQTEIYDKIWYPKIEGVLHERTSYFFRDLLQYKESKPFKVISDNNTKELYAIFKEFVEREYKDNRKAFIEDAKRFVNLYKWIDEVESEQIPKISSNIDNNKLIIELLRNIFHDIKTEAFKPFVLGLLEFHQFGFNYEKLSDENLVEALKIIRTYLIRRRALKVSQGENKEIPLLSKEIYENHSSWFNGAKEQMLTLLSKRAYNLRIPNNVEVASELRRIDFYNGLRTYSKFILGKIEEMQAKMSVDFRDKKATIEHIMPQEVEKSEYWQNELGNDWSNTHKKYIHNIGNLILTEFNSEIGNKPLASKREKLKESNFLYRKDVINNETWKEKDILNHQKNMIERFLKAFPLPQEMHQTENWDNSKPKFDLEIFSPLNDAYGEIVEGRIHSRRKREGRKPKEMTLYDDVFHVSEWQEVYLIFLRWLEKNNSFAFGNLFYKFSNAKNENSYPLLAKREKVLSLSKENKNIGIYYKRLSDDIAFKDSSEEIEEDSIYVFAHRDAKTLVGWISEIMSENGMDEESVLIEMKPIL
ncbi:MAG: DUF262 domain-containing HNH endonuclease family protein [Firmicutes bacterium]|nr:DUF262 domain-containing HNH endonuclease family protein [Bacillota bacterium]